jgi:proline dehydrogenase
MRLTRLLQPVLFPFAKRFVAGTTAADAIAHTRKLNDAGVTAMIDLLGEHVDRKPDAERALTRYVRLLDRIEEAEVDAQLSIKLTHLGLEIGQDYCRSNVHHLVEHAADHDTFVWIDMESSAHTDATIDLYKELRDVHENVGICIQSYLHRSSDDVAELLEHDAIIRLVKGAYDEPTDIAYRNKDRVREAYRDLLDQLFGSDAYVAIATHDTALIEYAQRLDDEHDTDPAAFEFQFLMGVRDQLQRDLADQGYNVAEYVPYGPDWLPYYWRRIRERQENLVFAIKAVVYSLLGRS